jgi:ubiquinone/menaquinone biosynthesis C-methylase UbiE
MVKSFRKRVPEDEELMEDDVLTKKYIKIAAKDSIKIVKSKKSSYYRAAKIVLKGRENKKIKILDLACGYGGLSNSMAAINKNADITCLDASKWTLELGNKLKTCKSMNFVLGRAESLPFKDYSFDMVVCRDAVHQFRNPVKIFKEAFRATKNGGDLHFIDLDRDTPEIYITDGLLKFFYSNPRLATQYLYSIRASYTIAEIKKMLSSAKIKNYSIKSLGNRKNDEYLRTRWILKIKK